VRQSESCTPAPGGKQQLGPGTERSIVSPAAQLQEDKMLVVVARASSNYGKHDKGFVCKMCPASVGKNMCDVFTIQRLRCAVHGLLAHFELSASNASLECSMLADGTC